METETERDRQTEKEAATGKETKRPTSHGRTDGDGQTQTDKRGGREGKRQKAYITRHDRRRRSEADRQERR